MLAAERQQALTAIARRREILPQVANRCSEPQRMQDAGHVTQPFGEDDALAGALRGLIGIAERPSGHCALPLAADPVVPMLVRVVKGNTELDPANETGG